VLERTHKKAARVTEMLLKSAVANAVHNDKQREEDLRVRSIIVNQAQGYRRGVPMARGRMRPMRKFLSHMEIVLGVGASEGSAERSTKETRRTKSEPKASQGVEKPVKKAKKDRASTSTTSRTSAASPTS
jgi:hypothetical protein